jgi:hypothetical protein
MSKTQESIDLVVIGFLERSKAASFKNEIKKCPAGQLEGS